MHAKKMHEAQGSGSGDRSAVRIKSAMNFHGKLKRPAQAASLSVLQCTTLHNATQQNTTVHNTKQQCTTVHTSTLQCTIAHNSTQQCTTLNNSTQQCITLKNSTQQCITLKNKTQQYTTLHLQGDGNLTLNRRGDSEKPLLQSRKSCTFCYLMNSNPKTFFHTNIPQMKITPETIFSHSKVTFPPLLRRKHNSHGILK